MNNESKRTPYVSMPEAFMMFWQNFADFGGKSSRSEYWWMEVWDIIIAVAGLILVNVTSLFGIILVIYGIASVIPNFALLIRRLRDQGSSNGAIATLIVLDFIPFINFITGIITFILTIMPGKSDAE